jgi:hypothetical protein
MEIRVAPESGMCGMKTFSMILMGVGFMLVIFSVVRSGRKNRGRATREINNSMKNLHFHYKQESNDFGQKVKWAIDIDEPGKERPSGGSEPPAVKGG